MSGFLPDRRAVSHAGKTASAAAGSAGKRISRFLCVCLLLSMLLPLSLAGCAQQTDREDGDSTPVGTDREDSAPVGTDSVSTGTDSASAGTDGASVGMDLFSPRQEDPLPLPERFALPYEAEHTLDPITCPDGMQQVVGSLLYEGLFRLDRRMEPEPCLCDSFGADASFRSWTFVLPENVTFSDGSPLTAREVKATLDRARESVRYGNRLRNIASMTAAGDTLFVTLYAPDAGFPALLDIPVCKQTGGVPLGTGPYYFAREDSGAWLLANPGWRRGGGQPVQRIFLEESQNAMLYRFTSGDVHLIVSNLIGGDPASITGDIAYTDAPSLRFFFLSCNTRRGPLTSAALRRALNLGVNREGIAQALLSGHALPAQFPVSPASPLYPKDLDQPYATDALSVALAEIGYEADRSLVLLVNSENGFKVSVAESIAASCTAAGVPTEVRALPWEAYREAVSAGNWDLCFGEALVSADWNLSPLLAAEGSLNLGGWSDWRGTQLLSAFNAAEDRAAAMGELCAYLRENAPLIPLCFGNVTVLTRKGVVENLSPTASEPFYNLTDCAVHLREPAGEPEA